MLVCNHLWSKSQNIKTHEAFGGWACCTSPKLWDLEVLQLDSNQKNQIKLLAICCPIKNLLFFNAYMINPCSGFFIDPYLWIYKSVCLEIVPSTWTPHCTSFFESFVAKMEAFPSIFFVTKSPPKKDIMLTLLRWVGLRCRRCRSLLCQWNSVWCGMRTVWLGCAYRDEQISNAWSISLQIESKWAIR